MYVQKRALAARFFCRSSGRLPFIVLFLTLFTVTTQAQRPQRPGLQNIPGAGALLGGGGGGGRSGGGGPFKDSLLHRTGMEDSATILYRYLDTSRFLFLDSSVNDFTKRWPIAWTSIFLGNTGSASRSLLFSPRFQPGWDHGMHAYDAYTLQENQVRFYNTTRPFTELSYVLGSRAEQNIGVLHTQNIRYNWNFSFRYNLMNAPGIFRNQLTNHNNYLFNTWYTSPNRRYNAFFYAGASRLAASENGGLRNLALLDSVPSFSDRFNIPANFGGNAFSSSNFLNNTVNTGNRYNTSSVLLRQSYDLGKKDSVVTDSATTYLFYPRLRFQHTFRYNRYSFEYADSRVDEESYRRFYGLAGLPGTYGIRDAWQAVTHEAAVYQFPDIKNQLQFLKVAAGYQRLQADFGLNESAFTNLYVNGEYRNKTRNRKWDMELTGTLFAAGAYAGDYQVLASLKRVIGARLGSLALSFENVNRTPSFVHDDRSNFKVFNRGNTNFGKENSTRLSGVYELPAQRLQLAASYYLLSNFTYFKSFTESVQEATLFNVLQVQGQKQFRLNRYWNWYAEIFLQQATANAPVNLPLLLTRQRLAYEGRFFKNLNLSTGLELRYHTPYKADGYSPVLGQFFLQNDTLIRNRPDIAAFFHVRIRSWYLFVRGENLNTLQFNPAFGFLRNNFATPLQPTPGLFLRFGIYWGFVN